MKRSHKKRTKDLWNTRREIQIETELDQPSWKNGQYQTSETRPQLQTSGQKRSWTPQEKMATPRCRNRSNELIHGGRWWWWLSVLDRTRTCGRYFLTEEKLVVIDGKLQTFPRKSVAGFAPQMNLSAVSVYTEGKRRLLRSRKLSVMKFTYNETRMRFANLVSSCKWMMKK